VSTADRLALSCQDHRTDLDPGWFTARYLVAGQAALAACPGTVSTDGFASAVNAGPPGYRISWLSLVSVPRRRQNH
jgi:hypothetical protein